MLKIGVIGCGHWGPNHIRVFSQLPDVKVVMCADPDRSRLQAIKRSFPDIFTVADYHEVLATEDIQAVCIATPTNTHYDIAHQALSAGKHVLCEKPLSLHPKECDQLGLLARRSNTILMVGHVFVFNQGIIKLKQLIDSGELGHIQYAHAKRTNLGPFRYDVNALWDLAPHDVSIFNYLFNGCPVNVSACGQKYLGDKLEDVAFATMQYPNRVMANMHVSWLDPKKVRQVTVVGDKKMAVWDDLDNVGPVKIYDKHVERTSTYYESYGEFQLLSKEGDITIPKIGLGEPLKDQALYFIDCILNHRLPDKADAQKASDVVKTLCAVQQSIEHNGAPVDVDQTAGT